MEEVFFHYFSYHSSLVVQNDSKIIHFDVGSVLSLKGEEKMKIGALYRLRMYHPAIDAVGIFT